MKGPGIFLLCFVGIIILAFTLINLGVNGNLSFRKKKDKN